jgi:hypothetical protein
MFFFLFRFFLQFNDKIIIQILYMKNLYLVKIFILHVISKSFCQLKPRSTNIFIRFLAKPRKSIQISLIIFEFEQII